jgi:hypothetical protein
MSLAPDYITVPGQNFVCLSVVGPSCPQKTDKFGIKIRGCFATRDEAAAHAKKLQADDATFDIYVADMYKFLLIPPDPAEIEDSHYAEEKLEELMTGYRENQRAAQKLFEERKRDMMERKDGDYSKPGDENSRFYTKPDEPPIEHPAEVIERLKKDKPDAPMEELVKEADAEVARQIEERRKKREAEAEAEAKETEPETKEE